MLTWLADALRDGGQQVSELDGWKARGRAGIDPKVIVVHHTGAPGTGEYTSLNYIAYGSSIAPLSNLHLSRTTGLWTVVAAGKTNNAGAGGWGDATSNYHTIGIEAEHSGDTSDPWPCYRSYVDGVAALCRRLGWGPDRVVGHKEWAPGRKSDPTFDMDRFRGDVAAAMSGSKEDIMRQGDNSTRVAAWQSRLAWLGIDLTPDGDFGPKTVEATKKAQGLLGLAPDGEVHATEWALLVATRAGNELTEHRRDDDVHGGGDVSGFAPKDHKHTGRVTVQ